MVARSRVPGLGINGTLTPALVPTVTFGPTLGIAAGRINTAGYRIRSFREPLMAAIRTIIIPSIRRNFDEGGRPAWEPLAEDTITLRGLAGFSSGPILVRTGKLARVAAQINIWDVTGKTAVIRDLPERVWYGKVHQAGYDGNSMSALIAKHDGDVQAAMNAHTDSLLAAEREGRSLSQSVRSIPARPFLMFQPEDEQAIVELFATWMESRVLAGWK